MINLRVNGRLRLMLLALLMEELKPHENAAQF
jgi:hypothetical protein